MTIDVRRTEEAPLPLPPVVDTPAVVLLNSQPGWRGLPWFQPRLQPHSQA